jgi:hypothetical protein
MRILMVVILIASLYIVEARASQVKEATQVTDVVATVSCGKSEQPTPCVLILDKTVPFYELTVKNADRDLCSFKAERIEGAWKVLGETRREKLIEVMVDAKDGSYTVFNPRRPDLEKDVVPDGFVGLLVRTVQTR